MVSPDAGQAGLEESLADRRPIGLLEKQMVDNLRAVAGPTAARSLCSIAGSGAGDGGRTRDPLLGKHDGSGQGHGREGGAPMIRGLGCGTRECPATIPAIPNREPPAAHGNAGGMPSSHPCLSPGPSTGADRQDRVCRSTAGVDTVEEIPDALVAARRVSRWPSGAPRGRGGSPTTRPTVIARLQASPFPPCFRALCFFSGSAEIVGSRGPFEGSNPPPHAAVSAARSARQGGLHRVVLS